MQTNVGTLDKIVRIVVGLGLLSLYFVLEGNLRYLGAIGVIPLFTAFVGWCPLYIPLKLNTCAKK